MQKDARFIRDLQVMLRSIVAQVDDGASAGLSLDALKERVIVEIPPGSIYATASARALDALFRVPAIESALKEVEKR